MHPTPQRTAASVTDKAFSGADILVVPFILDFLQIVQTFCMSTEKNRGMAKEYAENLGINLCNLHEFRKQYLNMNIRRIMDAKVGGFFDDLDHGFLQEIIQ